MPERDSGMNKAINIIGRKIEIISSTVGNKVLFSQLFNVAGMDDDKKNFWPILLVASY